MTHLNRPARGRPIQYQPGPPGPLCAGANGSGSAAGRSTGRRDVGPGATHKRQDADQVDKTAAEMAAAAAGTCGRLCTGFHCESHAKGDQPPDFHDPLDLMWEKS